MRGIDEADGGLRTATNADRLLSTASIDRGFGLACVVVLNELEICGEFDDVLSEVSGTAPVHFVLSPVWAIIIID